MPDHIRQITVTLIFTTCKKSILYYLRLLNHHQRANGMTQTDLYFCTHPANPVSRNRYLDRGVTVLGKPRLDSVFANE